MNDRMVTAIGAIVALVLVYGLFFASNAEAPVTRPLSNEAGRNGYLALSTWLDDEGIAVVSWRDRFDERLTTELAATGNVMLTTTPLALDMRDTEVEALQGWIRRGNTLLIMAPFNDTPEWSDGASLGTFLEQIRSLTGLSFSAVPPTEPESAGFDFGDLVLERVIEFAPLEHPLQQGIERLQGYTDDSTSQWQPIGIADYGERPIVSFAYDLYSGTDAAWEIPVEAGRMLLIASGSMLTNHQIGEADNARFVSNLLGYHLGADGAFVFDDMHQGLTTIYDPAAFYSDRRLHLTLAFLVAAWFVYLLAASNRVAPVRPPRTEPRQADLVAGVGGFMARRLDRCESGLLLYENWFDEVRRRRGLMDDGSPPWTDLAATPALNKNLLARLRDQHEQLANGRAVDLVALHNLILKAREAIG